MSSSEPSGSNDGEKFQATLTGGIADIGAILPLLGTEQVERHVASALDGGYIYAAAAPLSIFGSLGVAKVGITILISSVSLPRLRFSWKKLFSVSRSSRWLGGRILQSAGFSHSGTVAPLIGLDDSDTGTHTPSINRRFKAETAFLEVLEQQHIDDFDKLVVRYEAKSWNRELIIGTVLAIIGGLLPYVHLVVAADSASTRAMLTFPVLRAVGCGLGAVCSQRLMQLRINSLLQARLTFEILDKYLKDMLKKSTSGSTSSLKMDAYLQWDGQYPAEDCLWRLKNFVADRTRADNRDNGHGGQIGDDVQLKFLSKGDVEQGRLVGAKGEGGKGSYRTIGGSGSFDEHIEGYEGEGKAREKSTQPIQFSEAEKEEIEEHLSRIHLPKQDRIEYIIFWLCLFVSIPMMVVGYIGSFTFAKTAGPDDSSDAVFWVLLELALAVIRIIFWTANPEFDEHTGIQVELDLSNDFPSLTTENGLIKDPHHSYIKQEDNADDVPQIVGGVFKLVPEGTFLQHLTSYTGPLEKFDGSPNKVLYFTMPGHGVLDWKTRCKMGFEEVPRVPLSEQELKLDLVITVLDLSTREALVLVEDTFYEATIDFNRINKSMEAQLEQKAILLGDDDELRIQVFHYRKFLLAKLAQRSKPFISIPLHWTLVPNAQKMDNPSVTKVHGPIMLRQPRDHLLLDLGSEQELKAALIEHYGRELMAGMETITDELSLDAYQALADPSSKDGQSQLAVAGCFMDWEYLQQEFQLLKRSLLLEGALYTRLKTYLPLLGAGAHDKVRPHFYLEQRNRLHKEMDKMVERISDMEDNRRKPTIYNGFRNASWKAGKREILAAWSGVIIDAKTGARSSPFFEKLDQWKSDLYEIIKGEESLESLLRHIEKRWDYIRDKDARLISQDIDAIQSCNTANYPKMYSDCFATYADLHTVYRKFRTAPNSRTLEAAMNMVHPMQLGNQIVAKASWRHSEAATYRLLEKTSARTVINLPDSVQAAGATQVNMYYSKSILCTMPVDLPFVGANREGWWRNAESLPQSSSTFYYRPDDITVDNRFVTRYGSGTVCCVMLFVQRPAHVALHLVHRRWNAIDSVAVVAKTGRGDERELCTISGTDIPDQDEPVKLSAKYDLGVFQDRGRYTLEIVVNVPPDPNSAYLMRDVLVQIEDVKVDSC